MLLFMNRCVMRIRNLPVYRQVWLGIRCNTSFLCSVSSVMCLSGHISVLGLLMHEKVPVARIFSRNIQPNAAKCGKMAPHREKMIFLQNPWIFGNFGKFGANSEKIEKIASGDSLEPKHLSLVRSAGEALCF